MTVDMGWNTRRFQYPNSQMMCECCKVKSFVSLASFILSKHIICGEKLSKNIFEVFAGFLNTELNFNIY